jgi:hypothetical protein
MRQRRHSDDVIDAIEHKLRLVRTPEQTPVGVSNSKPPKTHSQIQKILAGGN